MELRITNSQENWLTEQILWNNEELKAAITGGPGRPAGSARNTAAGSEGY